jgi:uncharacterized protein (DUF488 family)
MADRGHPQHGPDAVGPPTIWTIGHSTHPIETFLKLLAVHTVDAIADVRRFPGSRRHPQFGREALQQSLEQSGRAYLWIPRLGGRRKGHRDSTHTQWRNPGFRAYADYSETEEFAAGLEELLAFAQDKRAAVMCAERLWWQCHRMVLSDVLRGRGIEVLHILDASPPQPHSPLV